MAFQQAQDQIGLANQFKQQGLASGQQDLQAKVLQNLFQSQNDPLKLQQQRLQNQGTENANMKSGVEGRTAMATENEAREARRAKLLAEASEEDLKRLQTQAIKEYESEDPATRARGEKKLIASKAEFDRRNATADKQKLQREELDSREKVAAGNNAATLGAAQIGANARVTAAGARGKTNMDFDAAVAAGKISPAKAAVYYAIQAQQSDDPQEQAGLYARAAQFEKLAQSTTGAPKTGVDVPAVANLPEMKAPTAFGGAPAPKAPAGRVSVIGPNGKTGTIPADQLEQALKSGYKQR